MINNPDPYTLGIELQKSFFDEQVSMYYLRIQELLSNKKYDKLEIILQDLFKIVDFQASSTLISQLINDSNSLRLFLEGFSEKINR